MAVRPCATRSQHAPVAHTREYPTSIREIDSSRGAVLNEPAAGSGRRLHPRADRLRCLTPPRFHKPIARGENRHLLTGERAPWPFLTMGRAVGGAEGVVDATHT